MSYRKAEEILPRELIEVIQQYVDGENIYIPRKLEHRKGWGERTQARQELDARNSAICREHREGASVPRLSQKYYLTEKSIWKNKSNLSRKLWEDEFDSYDIKNIVESKLKS